jgi:hypothetical protein
MDRGKIADRCVHADHAMPISSLTMATKIKKVDWPLAPAPESADHVKINAQYELFINGKWQKLKSLPRRQAGGKYFDTIDLANDRVKVCAITFSRLRFGRTISPQSLSSLKF